MAALTARQLAALRPWIGTTTDGAATDDALNASWTLTGNLTAVAVAECERRIAAHLASPLSLAKSPVNIGTDPNVQAWERKIKRLREIGIEDPETPAVEAPAADGGPTFEVARLVRQDRAR